MAYGTTSTCLLCAEFRSRCHPKGQTGNNPEVCFCFGVLCACASALTLPGLRCTATTKGLGTFSVQNSRHHHRLPCTPESCCAPSVTHPSPRSVASGVGSVALPHTWPHPRVAGCVEQLILVCCSKRFMPQCQVAETIMADLLVRPNMWRALYPVLRRQRRPPCHRCDVRACM